jgi:AcrR family transcriptional regulator
MASRAEHRQATLTRLSDAAIELFETSGPTVTIEAIAERAGVSRRTVFRYVDSKEELAFIHPVLWFDVFDAALEAAPASPIADRLRNASRAIAHHIDADPEPPRRAFTVVAAHPALAQGFMAVYQAWIERIAIEVISANPNGTELEDRFQSRIIGSAVMGMVDAVTRQWILSPPDIKFVDLYDQGFKLLAPLLDNEALTATCDAKNSLTSS